ncbi:YihY/virulence factor BrkB family protein [Chitinophaga sp. XS-30]|uniref:YihY/virulence factor BrkB family protein n=1 Tax=Chitinophaga sp. XS-30 TaxID=2604421 RepID=UPI0011DCB149|nr:YihY/virulence factor BrkB family protein [Chitinophaga sp. XS-30]QEH43125.1 YihY/virulence factor BrkB family protein [Chitinophaga sp. XS-30]
MIDVEKIVLESKPVRWVIHKSKSLVLPGFDGAPLYDVIVFFLKETARESLAERAAAISFNFLLAIPPFFIFILTLVPYIPLQNVEPTLYDLAETLTPNYSSYIVVRDMIHDFLYTQRNTLLSFAFILSFYYSSNGVMGMLTSFDKLLPGFKQRTWWQARLTALKLTIFLVLLLLATVVLIIMQGQILEFVLREIGIRNSFTQFVIGAIRWLLIMLLFFAIISVVYRFGPATKKKWKFISAGSTFATISMIIVTLGFSFWVTNFAQYNQIYGSIGTILVIMLVVYFNSFILLIGFELNTSITTLKEIAAERETAEKEPELQGLS